MQVLNLIREFELQRMKESGSVKEYSDRFLNTLKPLLAMLRSLSKYSLTPPFSAIQTS